MATSPSALSASEIFSVAETWYDRTVVLSCSGELDMLTAPLLERRVAHVLAMRPSALIVDLIGLDFLASAGMQVLVQTSEQIGSAIHFAVIADGPVTRRPMTIVGIDDLLAVCPSVEGALEYVARQRHGSPT